MPNNRELSQLGSYINVNDIQKTVGVNTDLNVAGIVSAATFNGNLTGTAINSIFSSTANVATYAENGYWEKTVTGINTNSNVGIGTTIPTSTLTVVGDVRANNFIGTATNALQADVSTFTLNADASWSRTSAGIHTLGNVGVGTTNPTSAVTVNGDISLTGHQILTGVGNTRQSVYIGSIETELLSSEYRSPNLHSVIIGVGAGTTVVVSGIGSYSTIVGAYAGERNSGFQNSFYGNAAGQHSGAGSFNSYFGVATGSGNIGSYNVFLGDFCGAGAGITNPYYPPTSLYSSTASIAVGYFAARNGIGSFSTYLGSYAGFGTSSQNSLNNVAIGYAAGYAGITSFSNVVIGVNAGLAKPITLPYNVIIGQGAAYNGTSDPTFNFGSNVIVGNSAGYAGVEAGFNVLVGAEVGGAKSITTLGNIAIGPSAAYNGLTGDNNINAGSNILIGSNTGYAGVSTGQNVLIGPSIGYGNTISTRSNVVIGPRALYNGSTGVEGGNIVLGSNSAFPGISSSLNIVIGTFAAGLGTIRSSSNVVIGSGAAYNGITEVTSTGSNIIIGKNAAYAGISSNQNTIIGSDAANAAAISSPNNTVLGSFVVRSGITSAAPENVAIGYGAGYNGITGGYNSLVGPLAGFLAVNGTYNSVFGYAAYGGSGSATSGTENVVIGRNSKFFGGAGDYNTFVGSYSGYYNTGNQNTYIGYAAGYNNATEAGTNNIAIGWYSGWALHYINGSSNKIVMGNTSHTNAYINISWQVISDERDKKIIGTVPHGKDFIENLETIEYQFKDRETGEVTDTTRRYGFSAQRILELEGEDSVIVDSDDPDKLYLKESHLIPVLVNAIKELNKENQDLKKRLERIEAHLNLD